MVFCQVGTLGLGLKVAPGEILVASCRFVSG